jgi:hypothetical protein
VTDHASNENAHGQINDVPAQREFFEFLKHLAFPGF